jgi:hypothetical protein
MAHIGTGLRSFNKMPELEQVPPRAVDCIAHERPDAVPLASTVTG